MGIASLVVSIIAIILSIIPVVGLPIALIALILAIIAMCRKKNKEVHRGFKTAGLIVSIIAFVISILFTAPILTGAYIVSKNSEEIGGRAEEATLASNVAELRAAVALEYSNLYTEYLAGKLGEGELKPESTLEGILKNSEIVELLEKVNSNSLGIKHEISLIDGRGTAVKEVGSNIIE